MLDYLITSKTRIKLLLKFFLNPEAKGYLRSLSEEFGESTNSVRIELNRFMEAGLLEVSAEGRTKVYKANSRHALFDELHSIVKKYIGIDQLVEVIVRKLGSVKLAFITGDYASGIDSGVINLVIVGDVEQTYLLELIERTQNMVNRTINVTVFQEEEFKLIEKQFNSENILIVWGKRDF